jgi:hypothetical protein
LNSKEKKKKKKRDIPDYQIKQATGEYGSRIHISSQSELDTMLAAHRGDSISQISPISPSSSASTPTCITSPPNPFDSDEYDTQLSDHFINGEIVCTGGLPVDPLVLDGVEVKNPAFSAGRSFTVKLGTRKWRRSRKTDRVKKVLLRVCRFFYNMC